MTVGLITKNVQCPCCWEVFEAVIDTSVNEQTYTEDCFVCCRPLVFHVLSDGLELLEVKVESEL